MAIVPFRRLFVRSFARSLIHLSWRALSLDSAGRPFAAIAPCLATTSVSAGDLHWWTKRRDAISPKYVYIIGASYVSGQVKMDFLQLGYPRPSNPTICARPWTYVMNLPLPYIHITHPFNSTMLPFVPTASASYWSGRRRDVGGISVMTKLTSPFDSQLMALSARRYVGDSFQTPVGIFVSSAKLKAAVC